MEQETMSKDKSEQQRHCQTSESQGRRDEGYTTGFNIDLMHDLGADRLGRDHL